MKIRSRNSDPLDVDMTPMIDIVFQLIAFFMVITNFEQTQADERVKLPKNELAKPPEVKRENLLTVNIGYLRDKSGEKTDPQPYVFFAGETLRFADIEGKLQRESEFFTTIKTPLEDVTVRIRADGEAPIGLVQELIQICQKNTIGFQRFSLSATQAEIGP